MSDENTNDNNNDTKIVIYTTPTCGFCHMAKDYLTGKGLEYETKDITVDEEAYKEVIDSTGQMGVPVISIAGKTVIGFDRPKIDLILREEKLV